VSRKRKSGLKSDDFGRLLGASGHTQKKPTQKTKVLGQEVITRGDSRSRGGMFVFGLKKQAMGVLKRRAI